MRLTTSAIASKWTGKNWTVIGDSITEHNFRTKLNYHDYIKQQIGCNVTNLGISGTGWRTSSSFNGTNAIYNRLASVPSTSDLITVFAGTNDWGQVGITMNLGTFGDTSGSTSLYGAIDQTLSTLLSNNPTKTIATFTPLERSSAWYNIASSKSGTAWTASTAIASGSYAVPSASNGYVYVCTTAGTTGTTEPTWPTTPGSTVTDGTVVWTLFGSTTSTVTMSDIATAIIKVANKYSVPVLDLYNNGSPLAPWNTTNNNTYFKDPNGDTADGLHPNDAGHQVLANKILTFINSL